MSPACTRGGFVRRHTARTYQGGLDEISAVSPDRAARPDAASSVAPVVIHYRDSLRPCLRTSIAPRRRATFRQTLLLELTLVHAKRPRGESRGRDRQSGQEREVHPDRIPVGAR